MSFKTADMSRWSPYTNPETGQHGWISAKGKVVYDQPTQQDDKTDEGGETGHPDKGTKTEYYGFNMTGKPLPELTPHPATGKIQAGKHEQVLAEMVKDPSKVTHQAFSGLVDELLKLPEDQLKAMQQRFQGKKEQPDRGDKFIQQAKGKPNAAQQGQIPEGSQQQHQEGDRGGQAPEASRGDSPQRGGQEQQGKEVTQDPDDKARMEQAYRNYLHQDKTPAQRDKIEEKVQRKDEAKTIKELQARDQAQADYDQNFGQLGKHTAKNEDSPEYKARQAKASADFDADYKQRVQADNAKRAQVKQQLAQAGVEGGLPKKAPHPLAEEFPGRVKATSDGKTLAIKTRYGEPLAKMLKGIGAKWNGERWIVGADKSEAIARYLRSAPKEGEQPKKFSRRRQPPMWNFKVELQDAEETQEG